LIGDISVGTKTKRRAMQAESTIRADVAVIGAGLGGCAAALAAARSGRRVILTEETRWIGGQLTSQAVPPDEHPWIEHFGASASYGFSVREPGPAAPDINPEEYHALLANAADYIVDRLDADIVFVSMERTDIQHSHAVVAHMHNEGRAEVLRRTYLSQQILALLSHFEFAVGMRLHFLIFAALRGVPFTALPYASKITGFLQDLGIEIPPLGSFSIGQLIARIDRSWDTRGNPGTDCATVTRTSGSGTGNKPLGRRVAS